MKKKQFYVTTPIYYANDVPHIGHAYTTIAADTIARHKAASGHEVYFLTGTDEHGRKVEQAAQAGGETPMELADRVVVRFQDLCKVLGISNTDFIRTTEPRHREAVSEMWRLAEKNGDIYLDEYEGWYDVREEAFITETQVEEMMKLPEKKRPRLEKLKEESYFFRLSEYQEPLLRHYREHPEFIKPDYRRNEVISFVEGGTQGPQREQDQLLVGNPRSRLRRARGLRLVRRPHQLPDVSRIPREKRGFRQSSGRPTFILSERTY